MIIQSLDQEKYHQSASIEAELFYVNGMAPEPLALDWKVFTRKIRRQILIAIIETKGLRDISGALERSGSLLAVLRHLSAPPISQDQAELLVLRYKKAFEKPGRKVSRSDAIALESAFLARFDRSLTRWLATNHAPSHAQIRKILDSLAPMMCNQVFVTERRNRVAEEQELAVCKQLVALGLERIPSTSVEQTSDLVALTFMRKTKCKASKTGSKEVDIAIGFKGPLIVAMECKVSNDATNSIKRINDILAKHTSWRNKWGDFIQTAAMLQGVIKFKEVRRLTDVGVKVFWSHDLETFSKWVSEQILD